MAIITHWCIEKNIYGPQMGKNIYGHPVAKNIYGPQIAKNIYGPPMAQKTDLCMIQDSNTGNALGI